MWIKVRQKSSGLERVITQKNYAAMGPKFYEKLYESDAEGNRIGDPNLKPSQSQPNQNVGAAAPVAGEQKITVHPPISQEIELQREAWTGDDDDPVEEENILEPKPKAKPGRKPTPKKQAE